MTPEDKAQRNKARRAVSHSVRAGRLIVPIACEDCGKVPAPGADGRRTIHAHHYLGYLRPLDVLWLCMRCHFRHDPRPTRESNGRAILTERAVEEIRATNGLTKALAAKYGVNRTTIQRARRSECWIDAALKE